MSRPKIGWLLSATLLIALGAMTACTRPENGKADPFQALNPFCHYSPPFRQHAVIEVDGERLEDTIVVQRARSRDWITQLNSAGCSEVFGTALVFRTRDGRVILAQTKLCPAAEAIISKGGTVDVAGVCTREVQSTPWPQGVLIDSADHPTTWTVFDFDADKPPARLISLTAQRTSEPPRDNIDAVAPALLRTDFADARNSYAAVDLMIPFDRLSRQGESFSAYEGPVDGSARWHARPPNPRPASAKTNGVGRENYTSPYYLHEDHP